MRPDQLFNLRKKNTGTGIGKSFTLTGGKHVGELVESSGEEENRGEETVPSPKTPPSNFLGNLLSEARTGTKPPNTRKAKALVNKEKKSEGEQSIRAGPTTGVAASIRKPKKTAQTTVKSTEKKAKRVEKTGKDTDTSKASSSTEKSDASTSRAQSDRKQTRAASTSSASHTSRTDSASKKKRKQQAEEEDADSKPVSKKRRVAETKKKQTRLASTKGTFAHKNPPIGKNKKLTGKGKASSSKQGKSEKRVHRYQGMLQIMAEDDESSEEEKVKDKKEEPSPSKNEKDKEEPRQGEEETPWEDATTPGYNEELLMEMANMPAEQFERETAHLYRNENSGQEGEGREKVQVEEEIPSDPPTPGYDEALLMELAGMTQNQESDAKETKSEQGDSSPLSTISTVTTPNSESGLATKKRKESPPNPTLPAPSIRTPKIRFKKLPVPKSKVTKASKVKETSASESKDVGSSSSKKEVAKAKANESETNSEAETEATSKKRKNRPTAEDEQDEEVQGEAADVESGHRRSSRLRTVKRFKYSW